MADLSGVLATLETLTTQAVYPNGLSQPSVAGVDVVIEQGWPIRTRLEEVLKAGNSHVSIFPTTKERIVTKFERVFQSLQQTPATLTATVSGNTVTIGGTITVPQAVMIIVDGAPGYGYQVLITDTLDSIATNLAFLIPGASTSGSVITIPGAQEVIARIATQYTAGEELSRQERVFMITCWAPSPQVRALLESAIDIFYKLNYRIVMSDGYYAQVFPETDPGFIDILEKSLIFRRDLHYRIQYATTYIQSYTTITDAITNYQIVSGIT